jgi:ribokinase
MDLVVRAPRVAREGETVLGGAYRTFPGGKGANQAVAAARLGASVSLMGCVGDDPHGVKLLELLRAEGTKGDAFDSSRIIVRSGESTGLALITVADGGENAIIVSPGTNALLSPADVEAAADSIRECEVLLVQLEIPTPTILAAVEVARAAKRSIVLNAAPARALPPELVRNVDVLVANRSEASRLLQLEASVDPARLAMSLMALGMPNVVVTLGGQGAILNTRGRMRRVQTPHVTPVDTTGAGDAFCAALATMWPTVTRAGKGNDELRAIEHAVAFASAAGALATTKPGAMPSLPRRAEVEALAKTLVVQA